MHDFYLCKSPRVEDRKETKTDGPWMDRSKGTIGKTLWKLDHPELIIICTLYMVVKLTYGNIKEIKRTFKSPIPKTQSPKNFDSSSQLNWHCKPSWLKIWDILENIHPLSLSSFQFWSYLGSYDTTWIILNIFNLKWPIILKIGILLYFLKTFLTFQSITQDPGS